MTLAELLALLGRYWSRMLLYPGGLGLLIALLLVNRQHIKLPSLPQSARNATPAQLSAPLDIMLLLAIAAPWLGLAMMPLPLVESVGRSVDLVFTLALLEWPQLHIAISQARAGQMARLATVLNSYPPLIGGLLLLALPIGALDVATIGQPPSNSASLFVMVAYWLGALGLVLALPALLGFGPFVSPPPKAFALRIGLALRAVGIVALASLPWAGLIPEALRWLLPLPVLVMVLIMWGLHRIGRQRAALPWAQALLWLCALEITVLLLAGVEALSLRLR